MSKPQVHELKTLPVYFDAVERGEKTFEIRRDDRGFQKGDTVRLQRYEPGNGYTTAQEHGRYARKSLERRILWILTGGQFGLEPGYVILALGPVDRANSVHDPVQGIAAVKIADQLTS